VVVPTLDAGVQFETVRLATELLDSAAAPSKTVLVVAGPLVKEKVPEQVPLTASVFEKPLAVNLACPARISKCLLTQQARLLHRHLRHLRTQLKLLTLQELTGSECASRSFG
jgi:hypothetical protein